MAPTNEADSRKKLITSTVITGIMTVALYAEFFSHEEVVMSWFTKGGAYAALPILTAFLFSFVHGAFTSNIWSILGVEAKVPSQPKAAEPFVALEAEANG
ncbi:hypothetical protein [Desulfoluna limicola]|nr:hypothetical protein [Desulfoluna limicola]